MRLVQFLTSEGERRVAVAEEDGLRLRIVGRVQSVYDLALEAIDVGSGLSALVESRLTEEFIDYGIVRDEGRVLPPVDHPDPARWLITGTGLTHLGSASARDAMHAAAESDEPKSDSMRIFEWGVAGGKPPPGEVGVQPEWFYKGDGRCVIAPEQALPLPEFVLDGGEESEIVGIYVIDDHGVPWRLGFAIGNEFSDHVMEQENYLYLAHSKLRACAYGPELLLGELPRDVHGHVRLWRGNAVVWEAPFASGEENMSHTLSNLEHHHFKYPNFRRPGDLHCHFFGAATLSFSADIATRPGDVFEVSAEGFGAPLRNPMEKMETQILEVKAL